MTNKLLGIFLCLDSQCLQHTVQWHPPLMSEPCAKVVEELKRSTQTSRPQGQPRGTQLQLHQTPDAQSS